MHDPHVAKLVYDLKSKAINYENPPPVEKELDSFRLKLSDGMLHIDAKEHYSSIAEARRSIEPFLRAWETDAFLAHNHHFRFEFNESEVIDRNPSSLNEHSLPVSISMEASSNASTSLIEVYSDYPQPPTYSALSPNAETLASRYRGYCEGREPLLTMAYLCLTVVEASASSRKRAASKYHLHKDILGKIGELSSKRGDGASARKYKPGQEALSKNEKIWLETAIRRVTRQVAIVDADETPDRLTMNDLPDLQNS